MQIVREEADNQVNNEKKCNYHNFTPINYYVIIIYVIVRSLQYVNNDFYIL